MVSFLVRPTSVKILRKQSFLTEGVKVQIVCEVISLPMITMNCDDDDDPGGGDNDDAGDGDNDDPGDGDNDDPGDGDNDDPGGGDDDDANLQARGSEPAAQIQWAIGEEPVSGPMVQVSSLSPLSPAPSSPLSSLFPPYSPSSISSTSLLEAQAPAY